MCARPAIRLIMSVVLSIGISSPLAAAPSFQGLGDLPGGAFRSTAAAVSANGQVVVGGASSAFGIEPFRWENGVMTNLGHLPGAVSGSARAVSADGQVVVGDCSIEEANRVIRPQAFRWSGGVMAALDDVPGGRFQSAATGVSADGSIIVGYGEDAFGQVAIRWDTTGQVSLGDVPGGTYGSVAEGISADGLVTVGEGNSNNGREACRWMDGAWAGLGGLAGPRYQSYGCAVSANGSVVVGAVYDFYDPGHGPRAFRWADGVMTLLEGSSSANPYGWAYAVSADGSVVVGNTPDGACLWDNMQHRYSLHELLQNVFGLDLTGWNLQFASGVSADGLTIVGCGVNPQGDTEGWIARLPEPATLLLLALGGLAVMRRKHRPR